MSTIPLSARPDSPVQVPAERADDPLDSIISESMEGLIDEVTDTIINRDKPKDKDDELLAPVEGPGWASIELDEPAPREAGLEAKLRAAEGKLAARETDSQDFHDAQEFRDELQSRYGGHVTLESFMGNTVHWIKQLRDNPYRAEELAAAYLETDPYIVRDGKEVESKSDADLTPGQKLNQILDDSIDKHMGKGDRHKSEFRATAQLRAEMKEIFPDLTFKEAMREALKADADLRKDALGTAARLAASFGMPVTPRQKEHHQITGTVAQVAATLPAFDNLSPQIASIVQAPEFIEWANRYQLTPEQRVKEAHSMALNMLARGAA